MDNERKDNYDLQKEIVDKNQRNVEELYNQVSDQRIRLNKNENAVLEQFDKISNLDYQDLTVEDIDSLISELDKTMQEMKDCYNEIISGTEDDEKKKGI